MQLSALARNGSAAEEVRMSREQAVADAEGLLRAEGLEMSPEHKALAARWVAGEIDTTQLEQLGLDLVRQRTAATATR
jgi:Antitoxin VbhA